MSNRHEGTHVPSLRGGQMAMSLDFIRHKFGGATSVGLELCFVGYDLNDEEPAKIELAGVRWVFEH